MSELAEFAGRMHRSFSVAPPRSLTPVVYPSTVERLYDIRAVVCDVYGTLIDYWREDFSDPDGKVAALLGSFRTVAEKFGMTAALTAASPDEPPEKTLSDFYHGLIALKHEQASRKGVSFPEIVIEDIWELIIKLLKRHGFDCGSGTTVHIREEARKIAWYYNGHSLGRSLYPDIVTTVERLKENGLVFGIVSNAQFYTPIDLTLLVREQSNGKFEDIFELFDPDLTFFSYEYQVAKPDKLLFRKLYDVLFEYQILPSQTVFVGNDLAIDIAPALEAGMKTALFTGDDCGTFLHDLGGKVIPDITFSRWADLTDKLSFHAEGQS